MLEKIILRGQKPSSSGCSELKRVTDEDKGLKQRRGKSDGSVGRKGFDE